MSYLYTRGSSMTVICGIGSGRTAPLTDTVCDPLSKFNITPTRWPSHGTFLIRNAWSPSVRRTDGFCNVAQRSAHRKRFPFHKNIAKKGR